MPKVVIELTAQTQQAIAQIQAFAKAQKDTFDVIRTGNPALAESSIRITKLTESTAAGSKGFTVLDRAMHGFVTGSLRELTGGLPVADSALNKLTTTIAGVPGPIKALIVVGTGLVLFLKTLQTDAARTADAVAKMSTDIQTDFLTTQAKIRAIRAEAAGRPETAATIRSGMSEGDIIRARDEAIAAAAKKRDEATGLLQSLIHPGTALGAGKEFASAREEAEQKANNAIKVLRAQLAADLGKIETDLDQKLADSQDKRIKDAADAAAKQKQLVTDLLGTFQKLGPDFEKVTQALGLKQFVTETQEQIAQLQQGIAQGLDTTGQFSAGIAELQATMAEAIRNGYAPTIAAVKELAATIETEVIPADEAWLRSITGISAALDEIVAKRRAARSAGDGAASATATGGGMGSVASGGGGATGDPILDFPPTAIPTFQHGGLVPGVGPVKILAHGGELVIPRHDVARGRGRGALVTIAPGAIQIAGTIIDQQRAWGSLVEELGQALEARLRR